MAQILTTIAASAPRGIAVRRSNLAAAARVPYHMLLLDVLVEAGEIAVEGAWQVICAGLDRLGVGAGLRQDPRRPMGTVLGLHDNGSEQRGG